MGPYDATAPQARNVSTRRRAAASGSGEATMSETTATPSRAWPVGDTQLCSVRSKFVDFIPPAQSVHQRFGTLRGKGDD